MTKNEELVELTNITKIEPKGTPYSIMNKDVALIEENVYVDALEEKAFFSKFVEKGYSFDKERIRNTYGKKDNILLSESNLKKIWKRFKETELADFVRTNIYVTADDILRIGIDRFFYALGIHGRKQIASWRKHTIHIGVCPHCKDEFVAIMPEINLSLCRQCLREYDMEAIRLYIKKIATHTQEKLGATAGNVTVFKFFLLFKTEDAFREMFLNGSEFAQQLRDEVVSNGQSENNE